MLVVITGGAGFIGSHLSDELLDAGHSVRVLDNLDPQVHPAGRRPGYLSEGVELVEGDVRDTSCVARVLKGADAVVHLAAKVGVGQSMYELQTYVSVNELGTSTVLEALIESPTRKLLVASSMSIYGEGLMSDRRGRRIENAERTEEDLRRGRWEPHDASGAPLQPLATPESKRPTLTSVYALSKFAQERMCLMAGRAYDIDTTALRFFNVYGPRQALSNPYTGVVAIFASRLLNRQPPLVFEDGKQRRDFVHVRDVAKACRLALEGNGAVGQAINVASGASVTVFEVAESLARALEIRDIRPHVTGQFRAGDIRHCFADTGLAVETLGFKAEVALDDGLRELVEWLRSQTPADYSERAFEELTSRGLVA